MRFLIPAHLGDQAALRVAAALRSRHGRTEVLLVSAEELALAARWEHRQDRAGAVTSICSGSGWQWVSGLGCVVFNRLLYVPAPHFVGASPEDRDYAERELTALFLSWLESLGPRVVNRPSPGGLGAQVRSPAEWLRLAGLAGLPTRGMHVSTDPRWDRQPAFQPVDSPGDPGLTTREEGPWSRGLLRRPTYYLERVEAPRRVLLVAGRQVVGHLAAAWGREALTLARRTGCDLLEIVSAPSLGNDASTVDPRKWKVVGVSAFPALHDSAAINAAVRVLEERSSASSHSAWVAQ